MQAEKKRREKQNMRYLLAFVLLLTGVFAFLVLNICVGSVKLSLRDVWNCFRGRDVDLTVTRIIWGVRFPRAVAALILGGALALAGYLLQTFFKLTKPDKFFTPRKQIICNIQTFVIL